MNMAIDKMSMRRVDACQSNEIYFIFLLFLQFTSFYFLSFYVDEEVDVQPARPNSTWMIHSMRRWARCWCQPAAWNTCDKFNYSGFGVPRNWKLNNWKNANSCRFPFNRLRMRTESDSVSVFSGIPPCQWKCWCMSRLEQNKSKTDIFYVTIHSIQFVDCVRAAAVVFEWVSIDRFVVQRTRMSSTFHKKNHSYVLLRKRFDCFRVHFVNRFYCH